MDIQFKEHRIVVEREQLLPGYQHSKEHEIGENISMLQNVEQQELLVHLDMYISMEQQQQQKSQ